MSDFYYSEVPLAGGTPTAIDEAGFKKAFIISSKELGDGVSRYMAVIERRIVHILQSPKLAIDELMGSCSTEGPELVIATSGRDRIVAGLNGKAVKPTVIKLTGHGKIAAGLSALAETKAVGTQS